MAKKKLKATVNLQIEYDTKQDLRECLADVRRELREGLGRGTSACNWSWLLTTGQLTTTAN